MLRALPVKEPQQLVQVLAGPTRTSWSNPLWEQLRGRDRRALRRRVRLHSQRYNLARGGEAQMRQRRSWPAAASSTCSGCRRSSAARSRPRTSARAAGHGRRQVAVISYAYWQRQYGGAADVLGKTIELDRSPSRSSASRRRSSPGVDQGTAYEVAIPLGARTADARRETKARWTSGPGGGCASMARLKPGDTMDRADRGAARRAAADARGDDPAELAPEGSAQLPEGPVQRCAPAANGPNGARPPVPAIRSTSSWRSSRWCS